jgi:hypothetical protein
MGFSPGEFEDRRGGGKLSWEGGARGIELHCSDPARAGGYQLLDLSVSEARKAANQLLLLVEMAEQDRL